MIQTAKYEIQEVIGEGAFGIVYKAVDKAGKSVAVKVLRLELGSNESAIKTIEKEARILTDTQHPNIVSIQDFDFSGESPYIVMEYVQGNLRQLMEGQISPEQVVEISRQTLEGLVYAHSKGIIHRDLRPENILIAKDGTVKLTDFGLAQVLEDSKIYQMLSGYVQGLLSGYPIKKGFGGSSINALLVYAAPEVVARISGHKNIEVDKKADLCSLGKIMYEMLTRRNPTERESPSDYVKSADYLDSIVDRARAGADRRYKNAKEMLTAIENVHKPTTIERVKGSKAIKYTSGAGKGIVKSAVFLKGGVVAFAEGLSSFYGSICERISDSYRYGLIDDIRSGLSENKGAVLKAMGYSAAAFSIAAGFYFLGDSINEGPVGILESIKDGVLLSHDYIINLSKRYIPALMVGGFTGGLLLPGIKVLSEKSGYEGMNLREFFLNYMVGGIGGSLGSVSLMALFNSAYPNANNLVFEGTLSCGLIGGALGGLLSVRLFANTPENSYLEWLKSLFDQSP